MPLGGHEPRFGYALVADPYEQAPSRDGEQREVQRAPPRRTAPGGKGATPPRAAANRRRDRERAGSAASSAANGEERITARFRALQLSLEQISEQVAAAEIGRAADADELDRRLKGVQRHVERELQTVRVELESGRFPAAAGKGAAAPLFDAAGLRQMVQEEVHAAVGEALSGVRREATELAENAASKLYLEVIGEFRSVSAKTDEVHRRLEQQASRSRSADKAAKDLEAEMRRTLVDGVSAALSVQLPVMLEDSRVPERLRAMEGRMRDLAAADVGLRASVIGSDGDMSHVLRQVELSTNATVSMADRQQEADRLVRQLQEELASARQQLQQQMRTEAAEAAERQVALEQRVGRVEATAGGGAAPAADGAESQAVDALSDGQVRLQQRVSESELALSRIAALCERNADLLQTTADEFRRQPLIEPPRAAAPANAAMASVPGSPVTVAPEASEMFTPLKAALRTLNAGMGGEGAGDREAAMAAVAARERRDVADALEEFARIMAHENPGVAREIGWFVEALKLRTGGEDGGRGGRGEPGSIAVEGDSVRDDLQAGGWRDRIGAEADEWDRSWAQAYGGESPAGKSAANLNESRSRRGDQSWAATPAEDGKILDSRSQRPRRTGNMPVHSRAPRPRMARNTKGAVAVLSAVRSFAEAGETRRLSDLSMNLQAQRREMLHHGDDVAEEEVAESSDVVQRLQKQVTALVDRVRKLEGRADKAEAAGAAAAAAPAVGLDVSWRVETEAALAELRAAHFALTQKHEDAGATHSSELVAVQERLAATSTASNVSEWELTRRAAQEAREIADALRARVTELEGQTKAGKEVYHTLQGQLAAVNHRVLKLASRAEAGH